MNVKVGNKIRVKGDVNDFTDHLDNEILTVIATIDEHPATVLIDENTVYCRDKDGDNWYIWIDNILEVIE